jgi:D-3-phosphoglycerate dehydrogenase / 2-oxoglutarate reductase
MKILITDKMAIEAIETLERAGYTVEFEELDEKNLINQISKYDALMIRSRTKVFENVIKSGASGNLKVIGRAGIGVDNIDIESCAKYNIKVVNAPTGATQSVAELAITYMLSLSRNISKADSSMKHGEWIKKKLMGFEIYRKKLGLVGCGNIGKITAKYALAFNMTVLGYDPFISKEDMKKDGIIKIDKLEDLMSKSDYISLHLPHIKSTHHIINEKMLLKMKKTAYIINCSRGGTVDEKALFKILKEGIIAGAGIDVFEKEPPNENPLFELDNVILTPHIGANTKEGQIRAGTICAEQIIKVLNGNIPDYWVNKKFM